MTTYTTLPESMKKVINAFGYTLGLDRMGRLYITHNEHPYYPELKINDNVITAIVKSGNDEIQKLSFNMLQNTNNASLKPQIANLTFKDLLNNIAISVDNEHSETTISLTNKEYDFSLVITLFKDGTIMVKESSKEPIIYSKDSTDNTPAGQIKDYLNKSDDRLIPLIEYFAGLTPNLSSTFYNFQCNSGGLRKAA